MCGEHPRSLRTGRHRLGSSPRVRGTRPGLPSTRTFHRFIPACAGNTPWAGIACSTLSVHPRVCGEHGITGTPLIEVIGSSPRVRGTRFQSQPSTQHMRFIPACAGNTTSASRRGCARTVHPRVCGEHLLRLRYMAVMYGSSPRVRGTHGGGRSSFVWCRFIPACAGNTRQETALAVPLQVHPRVCGEHAGTNWQDVTNVGSSPRVRGTLLLFHLGDGRRRFIPACAGNTQGPWLSRDQRSVHPRVCGEHIARAAAAFNKAGSSPRVRGTPTVCTPPVHHDRFIPACAGNTSRPE